MSFSKQSRTKWSPTGNPISSVSSIAATSSVHGTDQAENRFLDRSTTDIAWQITGRLLAGILFYGAIGWLVGQWLGQPKLLTAVGILFGMFASLYLVFARLRHNEIKPDDSLDSTVVKDGANPMERLTMQDCSEVGRG